MVADRRERLRKFLVLGPLLFAMLFNGVLFIYSRDSLGDPVTPFWVKVAKDVVFTFFLIPLTIHLGLRHSLFNILARRISLLTPIILGSGMLWVAWHFSFLHAPVLGIIKSYVLYFSGAAILVMSSQAFDLELYLIKSFCGFMVAILIIGLGLEITEHVTGIPLSFSGRMISTLGNPNYVGFASALLFVFTNSFIFEKSEIRLIHIAGISFSLIGLILSMSLAAIALTALWIPLAFAVLYGNTDFKSKKFRMHLIRLSSAGALAMGGICWLALHFDWVILEKIRSILTSSNLNDISSLSPRLQALGSYISLASSSLTHFLLGHGDGAYKETDGAFINLGFNFGTPILIGWIAYMVYAFRSGIKVCRSLNENSTALDRHVALLTPLILAFVLFYFWVQFVPEKYPGCFLVGWLQSQLILARSFHREANPGAEPGVQPPAFPLS